MSDLYSAVRRAIGFTQLPDGWDYGHEGPASSIALTGAITVLTALARGKAASFDVAPGRGGSITVVGIQGDSQVEVHSRPDGVFDGFMFTENDCADIPSGPLNKLVEFLEAEGWLPRKSSTLCTLNGIYLTQADTPVRHSKIIRTVREFRSCPWTVSPHSDPQSVTIFGSSLQPTFAGTRPYFGALPSPIYQMEPC